MIYIMSDGRDKARLGGMGLMMSPNLLGAPPVAIRICFAENSLPSTITVRAPLKLADPRILVTCRE